MFTAKNFKKSVRKNVEIKRVMLGFFSMLTILSTVAYSYPATAVAVGPSQVTEFTASVAPTESEAGASQSYTVTVTNSSSSTKNLKSAKVFIPAGFSITSSVVLGGTGSGWEVTVTGTEIQMQKDGPNDLEPGNSLTADFTATAPETAGAYEWTVKTWEGNSFTNTEFILTGSQPVVTIEGVEEDTAELCSDSLDNDGDSAIDLDDSDCAPFVPEPEPEPETPVENTEALCSDSLDNDGDELVDLNDPDCANFVPPEEPPVENPPVEDPTEDTAELCSDGLDNDNDGLFDLNDPDCASFIPEEEPPIENPPAPPEPPVENPPAPTPTENTQALCADNIDNDSDGLIDLADPDPDCLPFTNNGGAYGYNFGGGSNSSQSSPAASDNSGSEEGEEGEVLGASICADYVGSYMKYGVKNNAEDVKKLQEFLNRELDLNLPITGFFGPATRDAVNQLQIKYWEEILQPWLAYGLPSAQTPTGYVYKTTKRWINKMNCPANEAPMPQLP